MRIRVIDAFTDRPFSGNPALGIPEDPVTGGAHRAIAPFRAARLGRDVLVAHRASGRGGFIHTRVLGDRVELTGRGVSVFDGELVAG